MFLTDCLGSLFTWAREAVAPSQNRYYPVNSRNYPAKGVYYPVKSKDYTAKNRDYPAKTRYYPVKGVNTDIPYPRLDIKIFSEDPQYKEMFGLYLKALRNFQNQPEDFANSTGYYQICGIHGLPQIPWQESPPSTAMFGYYCCHKEPRFPTWHRPFTILFEQRLVEEAIKLLSDVEPVELREYWLSLAQQIRQPYWDWATDGHIPTVAKQETIDITVPIYDKETGIWSTGIETLDPNPLWRYKFQDPERLKLDFDPVKNVLPEFLQWDCTKRCPDKDGESHPEIAEKQLTSNIAAEGSNFREAVFDLLVNVHDYSPFSHSVWIPTAAGDTPISEYASIERLHDNMHALTGMDFSTPGAPKGHISQVTASGFDPLFWLHHSNVDRIYAMWQALNPQSSYQDQNYLTSEHQLVPFRKGDSPDLSDFWVTEDVQKSVTNGESPTVFDFNYYYPEVPLELRHKPAEMAAYVQTHVAHLYGPTKGENDSFIPTRPSSSERPGLKLRNLDDSVYRTQWVIFLRHKQYALKTNFIVTFFLENVDDDPAAWSTSCNAVGTYATFNNSTPEICGNCIKNKQLDKFVTGLVPLTRGLLEKGVDVFDVGAVEDYLQNHLHWRVLNDNHEVVSPCDVAGLKIGIGSYCLEKPKEIFNGFLGSGHKVHYLPTEGKGAHGGLTRDDAY
ncbi:hypothetical protein RUND412_000253 [Rhizina undulata]